MSAVVGLDGCAAACRFGQLARTQSRIHKRRFGHVKSAGRIYVHVRGPRAKRWSWRWSGCCSISTIRRAVRNDVDRTRDRDVAAIARVNGCREQLEGQQSVVGNWAAAALCQLLIRAPNVNVRAKRAQARIKDMHECERGPQLIVVEVRHLEDVCRLGHCGASGDEQHQCCKYDCPKGDLFLCQVHLFFSDLKRSLLPYLARVFTVASSSPQIASHKPCPLSLA